MKWYKQRHPKPAGWISRHVLLTMSPEDWREIEANAATLEDSVGFTVSNILRNFCANVRAWRKREAVEKFAQDKARNGDDSWAIPE